MDAHPLILGTASYLFPDAFIHPSVIIGHGSAIGFPSIDLPYPLEAPMRTEIHEGVRIGCCCVVEAGATIDKDTKLDHYVRVGPGTKVGDQTHLLYGTRVHCDVTIGKRCLISGNCPDRTIIGNDVRHFGRLHHNYRFPSNGWDQQEEPSAVIGDRTVIGANALIVGGVHIGCNVYIAAGETVHVNIPDRCVYYKGRIIPGQEWKGRLRESGFFEWGGDR